jgi:hypothetical protein
VLALTAPSSNGAAEVSLELSPQRGGGSAVIVGRF